MSIPPRPVRRAIYGLAFLIALLFTWYGRSSSVWPFFVGSVALVLLFVDWKRWFSN